MYPAAGQETVSAETVAEKNAIEAAKKEGVARCRYCEDEIWYHPEMAQAGWAWESEEMLGWCENDKGNRHLPKLM